ncbi:hypothetical protein Droror1_Dr00005471 [Drosera rotundifolia]
MKVFPGNAPTVLSASPATDVKAIGDSDVVEVELTVWRKSLLFGCEGFTVYDRKGNLVYRVDDYGCGGVGWKGEIVLMDSGGVALLSIRRKRLILEETWLIYEGEVPGNPAIPTAPPLLSVRKNVTLLPCPTLAYVTTTTTTSFIIEGSYSERRVAVYDNHKRRVAEIKQKEAVAGGVVLGVDVFKLIVSQGCVDATMAMGIVVVLDRMFGSPNRRRISK